MTRVLFLEIPMNNKSTFQTWNFLDQRPKLESMESIVFAQEYIDSDQ